jgi:hypothetical protein
MSYVPKTFFGFLASMMLFSVILSYEGIAREQRQNEWQMRYHDDEYYQHVPWFVNLTNRTIVFMDSTAGTITCLASLAIIPFICGLLAFRFERLYLGLSILGFCATFYLWIGMKLWLFDRFMPLIRM